MPNQFLEVMAQKNNYELFLIVTTMRADYQPEAVFAAEEELQRRPISQEQMESMLAVAAQIQKKKESRKDEPLSDGEKILAYLIPNPLNFISVKLDEAGGYDRKSQELTKATRLGCLMYIIIILFFILLDKIF